MPYVEMLFADVSLAIIWSFCTYAWHPFLLWEMIMVLSANVDDRGSLIWSQGIFSFAIRGVGFDNSVRDNPPEILRK
jgi:hypothetical protein